MYSLLLYLKFLQIKITILVDEQTLLDNTNLTADVRMEQLKELMSGQKESLKQFDMSLVLQLDQKVTDQQQILEQAGVPGFYVTANPLEVKVQMHLLDFILRLSNMTMPS